jgi:hypothetical protein
MHHPVTRFQDPSHSSLSLRLLAREFDTWLAGRERPTAKATRRKYAGSLDSLFKSIESNGDPLELAWLHPFTVTRWISEQRLSDRAHRILKAYLKIRPRGPCSDLWLQRNGDPLGQWGIESIFRRIKARCGVPRFHAHLCRHTAGTVLLRNSGDRAFVKGTLGHKTDQMSYRYSAQERKRSAARDMARHSAI